MSKRLSKYIASFDYFGKSLIVLSATTSNIFIASFATVIGTPVGIASASLSLAFSLSTSIVKKLLKTCEIRRKSTTKLDSIESKISEALINNEISHEDFMTILMKRKTIEN